MGCGGGAINGHLPFPKLNLLLVLFYPTLLAAQIYTSKNLHTLKWQGIHGDAFDSQLFL